MLKNVNQHNYFQHIRLISEGSCDAEECSNDAENSGLHHRNKFHFRNRKQLF